MTSSILATTYVGGGGAILFGMAGFGIFLISGPSAVLALALAPFSRTVTLAGRFSSIAVWGGLIAVVIEFASTAFIALDGISLEFGSSSYWRHVGESLTMAVAFALAPLIGLGARYWSRRTASKGEVDHVA